MSSEILLIDNNDSFTYNIVELIRKATASTPFIYKSSSNILTDIFSFSHIILSPGPGLPSDFPTMQHVLNIAVGKLPVLGICLGHQAISQHFGLRLRNLEKVIHGHSKKIFASKNSVLFDGLPDVFRVGLYHSWIIDQPQTDCELVVTSISEDGHIMSVENPEKMIFGVQFHPESHMTEYGKEIMSNFLKISI
jgi:para-aminobenzoate synthetase component 2